MKRTPIVVVAAIFVLGTALLVFGTPRPTPSDVRSATLTVGGENAGLVLVIDRPAAAMDAQDEEKETPEAQEQDILKAAPAQPEEKPGREVIEIENQAGKWRIRKPIDFPASTSDIDRIVEELKSLELTEVPSRSARTRESLMVDDAQGIRVTVNQDGRPAIDIVVGKTEDDRTFVRKHGEDAIWTVSGLRRDDLVRPLDDLRDKQIFDVEPSEVVAMTVQRGRSERSFAREGEQWKTAQPDENWLLDPSKVSGAAGSLARLRAIKFADDAGPDVTGIGGIFATAVVTFTAQAEGKTPTTYTLLIGNKDAQGENYYVARKDGDALSTIYVVSKWTVDRFIGEEKTGLDEYREKRVIRDVTADKVKTVAVSVGGASAAFEKGAGTDEWNVAAGAPFTKADGGTISEVVRKLVGLRADDFVAVPGLQMGGRSVTLRGLIEGLPRDIRAGIAASAREGSVAELDFTNAFTQNLQFLEQMARLYAVIYPASTAGVAGALRALSGEVRGTFSALRDPLLAFSARLAAPVDGVPVVWTLGLDDGTTIAIHLGAKLPDGKRSVRSDVPGDAQIYAVASDKLGDVALEDLNDLRDPRLLAGVPADRVTAAVFAGAGRIWEFARPLDGAWTQGRRTSVPGFDPEKLASAVRRVVDLQAVKFVRVARETAGLIAPAATVRLTYVPAAEPAAEGRPAPPPARPRTVA
ncbi:MAG: DUF4340 domain-containing protein, partial [Myxococcota bacterium]|nr:DUF4340 domain-containing protein [Myxococcota bacterium]